MLQSGGAADRQRAPPSGSPRSWSNTTVMFDLVDERAQDRDGCVGVFEVHVVTGARDEHVLRAQPSDALRLLFGREVAPGVGFGARDDEHRALDAALLCREVLDAELARYAEPEHRVRLPDVSTVGTSSASVA